MKYRFKVKLLFIFFCLSISILLASCANNESYETLSDTPLSFTLLGEVDHIWVASVEAGKQYEINVSPIESEHPANQILIVLRDNNFDLISSDTQIKDDVATLTWLATQDTDIYITILSKIGLRGEEFGVHAVSILEVETDR